MVSISISIISISIPNYVGISNNARIRDKGFGQVPRVYYISRMDTVRIPLIEFILIDTETDRMHPLVYYISRMDTVRIHSMLIASLQR